MAWVTAVPKRAIRVVFEHDQQSGHHYLYHQDLCKYVLLDNDVAISVIRMCDGASSIDHICRSLLEAFDSPSVEVVREHVLQMLDVLCKESFMELTGPRD